jgi:hypothetical protein
MPKKSIKKAPRARRKASSHMVKEDAAQYGVQQVSAKDKFRFIDLFCGIGGFRLAFERAGGECVFSSDWDKYSQLTNILGSGLYCWTSV